MADPLSSVASIIAVTQFALDLGRHVYQLASHYRNAAAVVESLCQELDGSNRLASHIKDVCLAAATSLGSESQPVVVRDLEASLDQHVNNLKQLQTVIQGLPARTSRKTFDNIRLASKLFKKQRLIEELRSRLASERQNMILLVSSISAHSVLSIGRVVSLVSHHGTSTDFIRVSPDDVAAFISSHYQIAFSSLQRLRLSAQPVSPSSGTLGSVDWLFGQMNELAKDAFEKSTHRTNSPLSPVPVQTIGPTTITTKEQLFTYSMTPFRQPDTIQSTSLCVSSVQCGELMMLVEGRAPKGAAGGARDSQFRGRIALLPKDSTSLGFLSIFVSTPQISRSIRSFRIHPDDAPIFQYLNAHNADKVRELLQSREVDPNDRDASGRSLVYHSIASSYSPNMLQLLIQHGAETSNCNLYGDPAIAVMLSNLPRNTPGTSHFTDPDLHLIQSLLKNCEAETSGTRQYKTSGSVRLAQVSLFHCLFSRANAGVKISRLLNGSILEEILSDLEVADIHGNTPLLCALYYCPPPDLFNVLRLLASHGVITNARNKFGQDGLHLLLRRLGACGGYVTADETADEFVRVLVMLLRGGCDPCRGDIFGSTAVDLAMKPTSWPLFYRALQHSGLSPREVVRRACDGEVHRATEDEVEELYQYAQDNRASLLEYQLGLGENSFLTDGPCLLCGQATDWGDLAMPFDEFHSPVVDELGTRIHSTWFKHCPGGHKCLNISNEDDAHPLDYLVNEMDEEELKSRSVRRHVALLLSERGFLDTPAAAQAWAKGI